MVSSAIRIKHARVHAFFKDYGNSMSPKDEWKNARVLVLSTLP